MVSAGVGQPFEAASGVGRPFEAVSNRKVEVEVGTSLAEMEKKLILATLEQTGGKKAKAAEMLGVTVRTLRNKLNLYRTEEADKDRKDESQESNT